MFEAVKVILVIGVPLFVGILLGWWLSERGRR